MSSPQPVRTTSGRFAGLDGIRALAIIAVFVFHLYAGWLPGGFFGVDVFFVISGFLITSLLIREWESTGRLHFKTFWTRRARRLLPALLLCVVVSSLLARIVSADLVVGLPRQVLGAATFSTNWLEIAANASYFDQTAPTLFMNFWSLAVEEQFYVVWPLITYALLRWLAPLRRPILPAIAAGVSTVLMAVFYVEGRDATRVYYGTDTHLMGLMLGAALAYAWASGLHDRLARYAARGRQWSGPAALASLLLLMLVASEASPLTFRGGFFVASLVSMVLVLATIARSGRATWWQRLLDSRPATWIGIRSYGLYLWHWPVILIVDQLWATVPGTVEFAVRSVIAVALTAGIADLSFRLLEMPIRKHGFRATGRYLALWFKGLPVRGRRLVGGFATVVTVALVATLATAPAESATAALLKRNAEAAAGASAMPSAGASATPLKQTWTMPTGSEIDGFGDSIMVGCVDALQLYFPDIRLDARSNRHVSDGMAAVTARGADIRRAVVLTFGMNAGVDAAEYGALLDALGPDRMVVVVNTYGTYARVGADNAALEQAVQGRDNVIIADWYATVKATPNVLQADRKHPSIRGAHFYAQTIQAAFAELTQRRTGVKPQVTTYPAPAR